MDFLKTYQQNPHFFAQTNLIVSEKARQHIAELVRICAQIFDNPLYQDALNLPKKHATYGVLAGFDFHLTQDDFPKLIEINTNAGGAFLNIALLAGQNQSAAAENLANTLLAMFQTEWQLWAKNRPLQQLMIVDEHPEQQFLYPEFLLAQALFTQNGITTHIVSPKDLLWHQSALHLPSGEKVDFVYNRLTDFALENPENHLLKTAYLQNAACFSPSPEHYFLSAQKSNLLLLGDENNWEKWQLKEQEKQLLQKMILPIFPVDSPDFWDKRKDFFFKPLNGYGSKAVYRGDKLTKNAFAHILKNHYVAQKCVPPSNHEINVNQQRVLMKADVRAYVYHQHIVHFAARLYQGQTTNFRTEGGGFALCV